MRYGGYSGGVAAAPPSVPSEMTGLRNLGNTCFFNSVSQLLGQTAPLVQYLTELEGGEGRVQGALSVALCVFLRLMQRNRGTVFEPLLLWKFVCKQHTAFASYAQQDAQELLTFMLVGLEEEYAKRLMAKPSEGSASPPPDAEEEAPEKKKKKKKRKVNNIIAKCFRGTFDSVVLCHGCGFRSHKPDDYFRDISVEIEHYKPRLEEGGGAEADGPKVVEAVYEARRQALYHLSTKDDQLSATPAARPASPSGQAAKEAPPAGLSKKEVKDWKARNTVLTTEADVRGRVEREEGRGFAALLAQRPRALPGNVAACDMKGVVEYMRDFRGPGLVSCLANFFAPETMDGDNKYKCGNCNNTCAASKQLSIASAPQVLTVHLKRFRQDFALGITRKIDTHVVFPLDLKLDPFLSTSAGGGSTAPVYDQDIFARWGPDAEDVHANANFLRPSAAGDTAEHVYRLFGVVVHAGTMHGGHYYCFVLPYDHEAKRRTAQWYYASDSVVKPVSVFQVLAADAYLLMYERV